MKAISRTLMAIVAIAALAGAATAATLNTPILPDFGSSNVLECDAVNIGSRPIGTVVLDLVGTDGTVWGTSTCTSLAPDAECEVLTPPNQNISARCRVTVTGGSKSNVRADLLVHDTSTLISAVAEAY